MAGGDLRLGGVAPLFARVTLPLLEPVLGFLQFLLGRVNQYLLERRVPL